MSNENENKSVPSGKMFQALTPLPENPVVTMAYVPFQTDIDIYETSDALTNGTLFKCLNKPFLRGAVK